MSSLTMVLASAGVKPSLAKTACDNSAATPKLSKLRNEINLIIF